MVTSIAELHLHLDGSLRGSTVRELADALGVSIPDELTFRQGMGLAAALSKFAFTLSLLQSELAVERVAREICEDAAHDHVTTLEIRFAPQLHRAKPPEAIVDAALSGIAGRAGLILCGLYGESPNTLARLVDVARSRRGVVGIDLAGGPAPTHSVRLEDYAGEFKRAGTFGLGRTVHAGEGRPAQEIRIAIEQLGAERIGHGTSLLKDPRVAELVVRSGVTIEACITSNVHTDVIAKPSEHPLVEWLKMGVSTTICADNTLLSQVTTRSEHAVARSLPGMTDELLSRAVEYGHKATFRR